MAEISSTTNPTWLRSTYSGAATSDCVEVRRVDDVQVRDSRRLTGARVVVSPGAWSEFATRLRQG